MCDKNTRETEPQDYGKTHRARFLSGKIKVKLGGDAAGKSCGAMSGWENWRWMADLSIGPWAHVGIFWRGWSCAMSGRRGG
jgi:hypothetical protein